MMTNHDVIVEGWCFYCCILKRVNFGSVPIKTTLPEEALEFLKQYLSVNERLMFKRAKL